MAKKKDLPAMPFYFGDWRKAPEIRALPLEDRMIWFEMLGFMWESTERGFLTLNGAPISVPMLARMVGITEERLTLCLTLLETLEVFSRREKDAAIYNRKMVRDEEIRVLRANGGILGGNPKLLGKKGKDKVNLNGYPSVEPSPENEDEDIINRGHDFFLERLLSENGKEDKRAIEELSRKEVLRSSLSEFNNNLKVDQKEHFHYREWLRHFSNWFKLQRREGNNHTPESTDAEYQRIVERAKVRDEKLGKKND